LNPDRPLYLDGEFDISIDSKGRFSVPIDLRSKIFAEEHGEHLTVVIGRNDKPWFYPDRYYRKLFGQGTPVPVPREEDLKFDHLYLSASHTIQVDRQGRAVLPEKILRRSKIGGEVTLIGARDHMEMWPCDQWEQYYSELAEKRVELSMKAQQVVGQREQQPAIQAAPQQPATV
jgi:MraZ protein